VLSRVSRVGFVRGAPMRTRVPLWVGRRAHCVLHCVWSHPDRALGIANVALGSYSSASSTQPGGRSPRIWVIGCRPRRNFTRRLERELPGSAALRSDLQAIVGRHHPGTKKRNNGRPLTSGIRPAHGLQTDNVKLGRTPGPPALRARHRVWAVERTRGRDPVWTEVPGGKPACCAHLRNFAWCARALPEDGLAPTDADIKNVSLFMPIAAQQWLTIVSESY
jgi:hypothetical protein